MAMDRAEWDAYLGKFLPRMRAFADAMPDHRDLLLDMRGERPAPKPAALPGLGAPMATVTMPGQPLPKIPIKPVVEPQEETEQVGLF